MRTRMGIDRILSTDRIKGLGSWNSMRHGVHMYARSFARSLARSTTRVDVTIQMANAKICTTHGAPLLFICIFDIISANIFAVITSSLRNR